jgi:hypothetical protein
LLVHELFDEDLGVPTRAAENVRKTGQNSRDNVVLKLDCIRHDIVETVPANEKAESGYWPLKIWLYGIITLNLVQILNLVIDKYVYQADVYTFTSSAVQLTPILIFAGLANLVFAVALLHFQKWGFWGLVATGFSALIVQINLGVATVFTVLLTVFSLSILLGLLRPGGQDDAWYKLH